MTEGLFRFNPNLIQLRADGLLYAGGFLCRFNPNLIQLRVGGVDCTSEPVERFNPNLIQLRAKLEERIDKICTWFQSQPDPITRA